MINIWKLEKEVRIASLQNRIRRHDIADRRHLLVRAMVSTASEPLVLGAAVLVGFGFGFRENHPSVDSRTNSWVITRILPLVMSCFGQTTRHDKQALD